MGLCGPRINFLSVAALFVLVVFAGQVFAGSFVCPVPPNDTYVQVSYEVPKGSVDTGVLSAYLYYVDRTSAKAEVKPVSEGALLLVVSGKFAGKDLPYDPYAPLAENKNKVCKMVTGADGRASAKMPISKFANNCTDYRVVFCPYTYNKGTTDEVQAAEQALATCAQINGENNKRLKYLRWQDVPDCPGAAAGAPGEVPYKDEAGMTHYMDLRNTYGPSQSQVSKICGSGMDPAKFTFFWFALLIIGSLYAAMFVSGRNPMAFLDFGSARSLGGRVGSSGGGPPPAAQQAFTPNIGALAAAADKLVNMAAKGDVKQGNQGFVSGLLFGDKNEKDEKDKDGNVVKKADPDKQKGLMGQLSDKVVRGTGLELKTDGDDKNKNSINRSLNEGMSSLAQGMLTFGGVSLIGMAIRGAQGKKNAFGSGVRAGAKAALPAALKAVGKGIAAGGKALTLGAAEDIEMKNEVAPVKVTQSEVANTIKTEYELKSGRKCSVEFDQKEGGYIIKDLGVNGKEREQRVGFIISSGGQISGAYFIPGADSVLASGKHKIFLEADSKGKLTATSIRWSEYESSLGNSSGGSAFQQVQRMASGQMGMMANSGGNQALGDYLKSTLSSFGTSVSNIFKGKNVWKELGAFLETAGAPLTGLYTAFAGTAQGKKSYIIDNATTTLTFNDGTSDHKLQLVNGVAFAFDDKGKRMEVGTYNDKTREITLTGKFGDIDCTGSPRTFVQTGSDLKDITDLKGLTKGDMLWNAVNLADYATQGKTVPVGGVNFEVTQNPATNEYTLSGKDKQGDSYTYVVVPGTQAVDSNNNPIFDAKGNPVMTENKIYDSSAKEVNAISVNGVEYMSYRGGTGPGELLIDKAGSAGFKSMEAKFTADFLDPITGEKTGMNNYADLMDATFFKHLDNAIDAFVMGGGAAKIGIKISGDKTKDMNMDELVTNQIYGYLEQEASTWATMHRVMDENYEKNQKLGHEIYEKMADYREKFEDIEDEIRKSYKSERKEIVEKYENDPVLSKQIEDMYGSFSSGSPIVGQLTFESKPIQDYNLSKVNEEIDKHNQANPNDKWGYAHSADDAAGFTLALANKQVEEYNKTAPQGEKIMPLQNMEELESVRNKLNVPENLLNATTELRVLSTEDIGKSTTQTGTEMVQNKLLAEINASLPTPLDPNKYSVHSIGEAIDALKSGYLTPEGAEALQKLITVEAYTEQRRIANAYDDLRGRKDGDEADVLKGVGTRLAVSGADEVKAVAAEEIQSASEVFAKSQDIVNEYDKLNEIISKGIKEGEGKNGALGTTLEYTKKDFDAIDKCFENIDEKKQVRNEEYNEYRIARDAGNIQGYGLTTLLAGSEQGGELNKLAKKLVDEYKDGNQDAYGKLNQLGQELDLIFQNAEKNPQKLAGTLGEVVEKYK